MKSLSCLLSMLLVLAVIYACLRWEIAVWITGGLLLQAGCFLVFHALYCHLKSSRLI